MLKHWGKHLLINARKGNLNVKCPYAITDFSKRLVKDIDMIPYGNPQVIHFGEDNKAGYTLVQLIQTSNITGHFCDSSLDFYIDVFSCKDYDEKKVVELIEAVFKPQALKAQVVLRDAELR